MDERVILVNDKDQELGAEEKWLAHVRGDLHRALSIFLFNDRGEMLLQQRALGKYHCGGLWSNTCCGHPRPEESVEAAAKRRLWEEMGISCPLEESFTFLYRAEVALGLFEHEFDHVFVGTFNGEPHLNPDEASDWRWIDPDLLTHMIAEQPTYYTIWFRLLLPQILGRGVVLQGVDELDRKWTK